MTRIKGRATRGGPRWDLICLTSHTFKLRGWRTLLCVVLLLPAMGCRAVGLLSPPTPTVTPTATPLPPTSTPSPTPSQTPSPSPTPTATPTPSATPRPTPDPQQFTVFQELWETVRDEYLYPDYNGLDWQAVYERYHTRIAAGLSAGEFYHAMNEMLGELGDDHSFLLDPTQVAKEAEEYAGEYNFVGIGIYVVALPEAERAVVLYTFPHSPAERAGLRARDSLLAVDGEPIIDAEGRIRATIRGPEGSQVVLMVQTPGEGERQVTVTRQRISSNIQVPYRVFESPGGKKVGYVLLLTFSDGTVDDQVGAALEAMHAEAGPLDGLIVDNRWNQGGVDSVLRGVLAYFTDGVVGFFVNHNGARPLRVVGKDLHGSQSLPLVVLTGPDMVSFGEVFAGVLRDVGRATLAGEPSEGNVESLWGYDFSDGSRAWIAHDSFQPLNHPEEDWEDLGIIPDREVTADWYLYALEEDPFVKAALALFDES